MSVVISPPEAVGTNADLHDDQTRSFLALFILVVALMIARAWVIQHDVITPEVYGRLIAARVDAVRAHQLVALRDRWGNWPYLFAPVLLALRAGVLASLLQLVLLLYHAEVSFGRLFRASIAGELVLIIGQCVHAIWLVTLPPASITAKTLSSSWGSPAAFVGRLGITQPFILGLAREITLVELAWCAVVAWMIVRATMTSKRRAAAAVVTLWLMISGVEWLIALYFAGAKL